MKIQYKIDLSDVTDLGDGSMQKRVDKAISYAVRDGLRNLEEHHKKKWFIRGSGKDRSTNDAKITWRTGNLARSYVTEWKKGNHFGYYGSHLKRARLLERGGTVSAKPGGALAIPTEAARVGVGGALWPRDYPEGELFIPKWGGGVLARIGKGGKLEVMFTLVKSVKVPARPTVKRTAKDERKPFQDMMLKRVAKAMELQ